jgi:hypothetical protein
MNSLQEIGLKTKTDKATYHLYLDFYEKHIKKESVKKFLEIGVQGGHSMKMWREWFSKDTVVEGWDILDCTPIDGVDIRKVDQLNIDQMKRNITGNYDLILDDGGHTKKMIETSFGFLFPYSKMYIIEDLHAPWTPWTGPGYLEKNELPTLELIQNFKRIGFHSKYANARQCDYINENAELVDIYIRGDKKKPLSAAAIFINKANK